MQIFQSKLEDKFADIISSKAGKAFDKIWSNNRYSNEIIELKTNTMIGTPHKRGGE